MEMLRQIAHWLRGGEQEYQSLFDAMQGDPLWGGALAVLASVLLVGIVVIALEWRRQERRLPRSIRRQTLCRLRHALLLGVGSGYVILPMAMVWPAWRLYVVMLAVLALVVWRFAWTRRDVKLLGRTFGHRRTDRGALANARAEARRKSFFLNALGHDLKNPLHGLTLQAQVAETSLDHGDTEAVRRALNLMRQCTRETNHLLDSFLELGRLDWCEDQPVPSRFELSTLIEGIVAEHQPFAEQRGLVLEQQLVGDMAVISDRSKLDRIIRNLLSNALKYTNQGKVLIQGGVERRSITVEVADTGPGIRPEDQEHLFDAFYRVAQEGGNCPSGYGLGLAITDRLARQLGGRIELESELGQGSRFRIVLPVMADEAPSAASQPVQVCTE